VAAEVEITWAWVPVLNSATMTSPVGSVFVKT
jgi:hypothetical protein